MLDFGPIGSRFRDVALLGGSAPVLYRAVHAGLGCPVLIKAMPRLSAGTSAPAALFVRGARAAARIDHPNVVRVLDLVAAPAADLLVQEWVGGPTLDDVLRRPEPMPIDRAFAAAAELADALAAAHARGLVHRSLSPAAVQFTPGGSAKLGGFEAAVVPDDPADPWPAQARLGNVLYTAPEQDRDGTASPRSDVYSLGALLYQMLTGRPPFAGSSPAAVQYQKSGSDPPPPARLRPDLPPAADQVVRRMMARNPGARFRDMADARDALRRFAAPTPEARFLDVCDDPLASDSQRFGKRLATSSGNIFI